MKKILLGVVGLLIVIGLGVGIWYFLSQRIGTNFQEVLSHADSMEIVFTPEGENKTYKKLVTHQPQVWLLAGTISPKSAPAFKCAYQGTIQFFAKGKPIFEQPLAFNFQPECQHVAFMSKGKIHRQVLLNEGASYLKDILDEIKEESNQ